MVVLPSVCFPRFSRSKAVAENIGSCARVPRRAASWAARGEDRPDSDIDILVEVNTSVVSSIFAYGRIQQALEDWIGRPVDLAGKDRLRPGVAAEAERDQILAF